MNRRLNPDLFNPQGTPTSENEVSYSAVATRKMETELKESKRRISHLESMVEVLQSQMKVMSNNNERRTQAFSGALSELEQEFREHTIGEQRRLQSFEERFRDQRMKDSQMENMIERYNTTLAQFENKLATLQKILSEKEMTLMTYRRIMEQIIDEVEKLKAQRYQNLSR